MVSVTLNKIRGEFARAGLRGVISSAIERPCRWMRAYRDLNKHQSFDDSTVLLSYTRTLASGWFSPSQIDSEITALLDRVRDLCPRVILEIGTANGGTLFMFTRVAATNAMLISIDLPGGDFGGGYPTWRAPLYRRFALPEQDIRLMRGDSHNSTIIENLHHILNGQPVDFLFLDGDHTYSGVKQDHESFAPLVRVGGLVAFHDIQPIDDGRTEVPRYWREIRDSVRGSEWIGSANQKGYGIGIYKVDGS